MERNYTKMENLFTGIDSEKPIGVISGEVGSDFSKFFAADLRQLTSRGIRPQININTEGGSVFGGMEIIDAMMDAEVDTHIVGMAFSMGGVISQFGKHRTANDFAVLMIHAVSGAKDKNLEKIVNTNLKNILMSRSHLTQTQLDDIFDKKKDAFFDAQEMLDLGLIDEIIETNVKIDNFNKSLELTNLYPLINKAVDSLGDSKTAYTVTRISNLNNNNRNMDNDFNEVKSILKLDSSDTERDVLNSIKLKNTKISDLETEVEIKDEEIEDLKKEVSSMNDEKAVELVAQAIESGKIKEESKATFEKLAKSDYNGCKAALEGIADSVESVVDTLVSGDKPAATGDAALLARGYDDIADKNPEMLEDLFEKKPELFNKLIDERKK